MKKWEILSEYEKSENIVKTLLKNRGVRGKGAQEEFLNPPPLNSLLKNLNPEFRNNLITARDMIESAIKDKRTIVIYGDYDADGVCATSILYNTIKSELNYKNCIAFIPNRFEHSYGLTQAAIDDVVKCIEREDMSKDGAFIVTVDGGVTAVEAINYAKSLGFSTIITDHHQKPKILPKADVIVWNDEVVGAGLAYILARGLGSKSRDNLALAATATVTDLQPILGINRSIVKEGLEVLNTSPPKGIKALLEVSGRREGVITTYDLGWVIGPRINASGRIVDAVDSLRLLTEKSDDVAISIAKGLNEVNKKRQDKTLEMYELVEISEGILPKILFFANENYHEGIIGLVAGKLVQTYYRPSIVISLSGNFGKGSVRSVHGINIIEMLREFEDMFEGLGGHPMAAGFTIARDKIDDLEKKLLKLAEKNISEDLLIPSLTVDMKIPFDVVDLAFADTLSKMKPFGMGNREPVFMSEGVGVTDIRVVGRDKSHLALKLLDGKRHLKGIFFGAVDRLGEIAVGEKIDVVYTLKKNEFRGNVSVDLFIKDFHQTLSD